jgi:uncharacterized membrane protein
MSKRLHTIARNVVGIVLGIPFISIGYQHFASPDGFNEIVPSYIGWPLFWTLLSGGFEIMLGLGIMIPYTRKIAAKILFALVILMSLANLNMWINDIPFNGTVLSTTGHLIRWTIQIILLAVLLWLAELLPRSSKTAK